MKRTLATLLIAALDLPASLRSVGRNAFYGRLGLKEADISGLETMGSGAFSFTGLVNIAVPGSLKEIPESAFECCADVETVTISEGVEIIRAYAFSTLGYGKGSTDTYNFLTDAEAEQYRDVVHADDPALKRFYSVSLPSTVRVVEDCAFLGTWLDGLYLDWLTDVSQLPDLESFLPHPDSYECIYVSPETYEAQGDALNRYFSQDETFEYWMGKVRVFEGRHHYWTDEELGIDA